uniref:40S ribosomal protein S4 n=1 Tax=Zea mays TaxID=4577 RepID=A0A804MGY2_MAIZE
MWFTCKCMQLKCITNVPRGQGGNLLIDLFRHCDNHLGEKQLIPYMNLQRHVLVDGKVRTDKTYPAGFMDVISTPKTNKNYRLLPSSPNQG